MSQYLVCLEIKNTRRIEKKIVNSNAKKPRYDLRHYYPTIKITRYLVHHETPKFYACQRLKYQSEMPRGTGVYGNKCQRMFLKSRLEQPYQINEWYSKHFIMYGQIYFLQDDFKINKQQLLKITEKFEKAIKKAHIHCQNIYFNETIH